MSRPGITPRLAGRLACLAVALWIVLGVGRAQAGWLIDPARFHVSAHGELSCLDCHDEAAGEKPHPDPSRVATSSLERFDPAACAACHEEVVDDLGAKRHGRRTGIDPARYERCIRCHDPHYLTRRGESKIGRFEPGVPRSRQCGACHEAKDRLPEPAEEDKSCLACHRPTAEPGPERRAQLASLCLACHASSEAGPTPVIDPAALADSAHGELDCLACHPQAADYRHDRQRPADCLACHPRHDEKTAREAHLTVSCQACHLQDAIPVRDEWTKRIVARPERREGQPSKIHALLEAGDEAACRRCHAAGNELGAAEMVLPAKSLICLPCHAATFSAGDATTLVALAVFGLGLILAASVWFSAGGAGAALTAALGAVFSRRILPMIKGLVLDGLLQRGLWRRSQGRWFIHALIFWPFVFRFTWGLIGLLGSLIAPERDWVWAMLDKNHGQTAFIFDLTGLLVLGGVALAAGRRLATDRGRPADLPGQDRIALALLAGLILIGYLLEGVRIAMTGAPGGAEYAFIGVLIGRALAGADWLTGAYGYLWYAHAIFAGAFVAYLPFSRMFHIILGPISAAMRAAENERHRPGRN